MTLSDEADIIDIMSTPKPSRKEYLVRLDPLLYEAASSIAASTGQSLNSLTSNAIAAHITSPEVLSEVETRQAALDDLVRRLSGE